MSIKLSDNLYLNRIVIEDYEAQHAPSVVNHIIVIDCSGSMASELPQIRQQLKNKLPKLLGPKDTVSIIWFSGRGQYGVLVEGEPVATLADLNSVNKAIDRWLQPIGLTGFVEPLDETTNVMKRVEQKTGNDVFAVFFMSDGVDNQWMQNQIATSAAGVVASSATVVEYGYYADRERLALIAEQMGGSHIFAKDFDRYDPVFEQAITKPISGAPRRTVPIPCAPVGFFVYAIGDKELLSISYGNGFAYVPANVSSVYYLSTTNQKESGAVPEMALYAALSLYSTRMMPDVIFPILRCLGDVKFIKQFSGCFGKDKYTAFQEDTKSAVFDSNLRLIEGYDPNAVPRDNAFTVLELLEMLDDNDKVLLDHPSFKYNRISRQRELSAGKVKQEEIDTIKQILDGGDLDAAKTALANLKTLVAKAETPELKFIPDRSFGYSLSGLVVAEDRANISIRVRKTGVVDLSPVLRMTSVVDVMIPQSLPTLFPTFVYRNYAIVKDGMVNVEVLPLRLSKETTEKIFSVMRDGRLDSKAIEFDYDNDAILFNLNLIPVVNRMMVKAPSATDMFELEWKLLNEQAAKKVYDHYRKELFPKQSTGFVELYGAEATDWLKDQGITEYNGFNPKSDSAESTDFYLTKELKVSLKGYSALPSVNDVKKRMESGKITPAAALMAPYIERAEVEKGVLGDRYENWLTGMVENYVSDVRKLQLDLAKIKFAVLVGQVWFIEFSSIEDCAMKINVDGKEIDCKVEQKMVEVKI